MWKVIFLWTLNKTKSLAGWFKSVFYNLVLGSRFQRRYRKQVVYNQRLDYNKGLLTEVGGVLLEEVFTEVKLGSNPNLFEATANPVGVHLLENSKSVWDILKLSQGKSNDHTALAIVDRAGCGKSTLLQHVALTFAQGKHHKYRLRKGLIPLFVKLHEYTEEIGDNEKSKENLLDIAGFFQTHFSKKNDLIPPKNWFKQQLSAGRCIVLLDGLDEVGNSSTRKIVGAWIEKQIQIYPRNRFLITSRPFGYKESKMVIPERLMVESLSYDQVREFIYKWNLAVQSRFMSKKDEGVVRLAESHSRELFEHLGQLPALGELMVNPLLLKMIILVYHVRNDLPQKRTELYADICQVFLEKWAGSKGLYSQLGYQEKQMVLEPLAAKMMKDRVHEISTKEANQHIYPYLDRLGVPEEYIKNFLSDLQQTSGLIVEGKVDKWKFAHKTFQEYLCACFWIRKPEVRHHYFKKWEDILNDGWWTETLRFYAPQVDATDLVKTCLQLGSIHALLLVAELLNEANTIDSSVRKAAQNELKKGLENYEQYEFFKVATNAHLQSRLQSHFVPIDENLEIDNSYVTCSEYQLFIDEKRKSQEYYQPDHWQTFYFARGKGKLPIVGVVYSDVKAFCDWLSEKDPQHTYHLPQANFIQEFPVEGDTDTILPWLDGMQLAEGFNQKLERQLKGISKTIIPIPNNFSHTLNFTLDLSPEGTSEDEEITLALSRALDHALNLKSHSDELALALYRARGLDNDIARARSLTHIRNFTRDLAKTLADDLTFVLNRELPHISTRNLTVPNRNDEDGWQRFQNNLKNILKSPRKLPETQYRQIKLLEDISNVLTAYNDNTPLKVKLRQAYRNYVQRMMFYAYEGAEAIHEEQRPKVKKAAQALYWQLEIIKLREEGKLPAWEGIRLVREKVAR